MGRPPIGERAMTAAEKMRRYRARKFGNRPPVTKPAAAAAERLAARVRKLEAELAAVIGATEELRKATEKLRKAAAARIHELEAELARRPPQERAAANLNWSAECNLDRGGTENASNNFTADYGKGQYLVDVRIRRSRGGIDLSRPRFQARWVVDRSLVKDGMTPSSNMIALGTFATEGEAKAACEQHAKGSGSTPAVEALKIELAQAHKRVADLERRDEGQVTRSHHTEFAGRFGSRGRFGSIEFKLRGKIEKLESDIAKLKMALQEEPDAAKLRKKVIDQRVEIAGLRQVLRRTAKERDEYQARTNPKFREAGRLLIRKNYGILVKALHSDRAKHASAADLVEAERIIIALRPLFDEDQR